MTSICLFLSSLRRDREALPISDVLGDLFEAAVNAIVQNAEEEDAVLVIESLGLLVEKKNVI